MVKQDKRKKILVQILCLLISFGLWIYINATENPIGQKTIKNVPVQILNTGVLAEDGLALAPNQNVTVNLNIKGENEKIYNSSAGDYKVILELGNTQLATGNNWLTAQVTGIPNGVTVSNPQVKVNLQLEPLIKKEFTIQSSLNVTTAAGVYVKDISFNPDVVTIEGASTAVNSVAKVVATGKVSDVSGNQSTKVKLVALNAQGQELKDVDIYPGTVNADITTYNGKAVPINVVTTGTAPNGVNIASIVPNIKDVEIIGDANTINGITSVNTEPINLSNITATNVISTKLVVPGGITLGNNVTSIDVTATVANNNDNDNNNTNNGETAKPTPTPNPTPNPNPDSNSGTSQNEIEKTFTVPIKITGEKSGYKYTLSNTTVSVALKGEAKLINNVNTAGLVSNIDVSNLQGTTNVKLNFNTESGISVVSVTPPQVSVTVAKDTETKNNIAQGGAGAVA